MASLSISMGNRSLRGFTLLEVLIVLALVAMMVGAAMFSIDTYTTYSRATEHDRLLSVLQSARTRAMNSDHAIPGGVALYPPSYDGYVIFSGVSYDARIPSYDENIPATYPLTPTAWSQSTIVFTLLSGTTTPASIVLTDQKSGRVSTTTITYDGYIE